MKVGSALITIAVGGALAGCSSTPPCEDEIVAFVMAQDFIKRQLRAPSTADFPMITADGVSSKPTTLADGRCAFDVRTYVDAQNAFGGILAELEKGPALVVNMTEHLARLRAAVEKVHPDRMEDITFYPTRSGQKEE